MSSKISTRVLESGKRAYELNVAGVPWIEVGRRMGQPYTTVYSHARKYEASLDALCEAATEAVAEAKAQAKRKVSAAVIEKPSVFDDFSFKLYIARINGKSYADIGAANDVSAKLTEKMIRNYAAQRGLPLR